MERVPSADAETPLIATTLFDILQRCGRLCCQSAPVQDPEEQLRAFKAHCELIALVSDMCVSWPRLASFSHSAGDVPDWPTAIPKHADPHRVWHRTH